MRRRDQSKVVYLIQGRSDLLKQYLEKFNERHNTVVVSWDKPIYSSKSEDRYFFLPNSTWAEGRNYLLVKAKELFPRADYYIFSDEDVEFNEDFLDEFEFQLNIHRPKIGVPLCDRILLSGQSTRQEYENPKWHDQLFLAIHRDVIAEGLIMPMDTKFDTNSWWLTCELQHYLIQKYYFRDTIMFNNLQVRNTHHTLESLNLENESVTSNYKNGHYSKIEKELLKSYIEKKFGKQQRTLDTIFQGEIHDRWRLRCYHQEYFSSLLKHLRKIELRMASKMIMKICFTNITNLIYQILFPNLILKKKL